MDGFDSYAEWLKLPVDRRPPNHYELLGLQSGESDAALIRAAGVDRSARVRRYCLGPHGAEATRLLGELGAAFACLSDPELKAAYDRQLSGEAASDSSEELGPPPIRHDSTTDDDDPPPRHLMRPDGPRREAPAYAWLKRRRQFYASSPARFVVGSALVLAATCGVVWFARRPPVETLRGTDSRQASVAAAPIAAPTVQPPDRTEQPAVVKAPTDTSTQARPAPVVLADAIADRKDSAGGNSEAAEMPARNADPAAPSASEADEKIEIAPAAQAAATLEAFGLLREPPATPANPTDRPTAAPKPSEQSEPVNPSPAIATQDDDARILLAGATWRLSTGDDPELLELTLDGPVDVAHLELLEPSTPAMIDRAIIELAEGSTVEIRPVNVFYHDGIRRWSFGSTRRARTNRFAIRFRAREAGFVEVAGVAVYDRMGGTHFPTLVRAIRKVVEHAQPVAATASNDAPASDQDDALEELARQQLVIARQQQPRRVADYRAILGDRSYVKTKAAIEAVSDLEQLIDESPQPDTAKQARRLLKTAATHKNTPVGEAASKALGSLNNKSPDR